MASVSNLFNLDDASPGRATVQDTVGPVTRAVVGAVPADLGYSLTRFSQDGAKAGPCPIIANGGHTVSTSEAEERMAEMLRKYLTDSSGECIL